MKKNILIIILVILTFLLVGINIYLKYGSVKVDKDLTKIDLTNVEKLMIIAHPDDETLWGSKELMSNDYFVVCITCGTNRTRVKEFQEVMDLTNDKFVMLGYPDKIRGNRDDWSKVKEDLINDLKKIIEYKNWSTIVTHNPDGEYGHQHHLMTNEYVTDLIQNKEVLFYFGKYYSKNNLPKYEDTLVALEEEILDYKINTLISVYKSQTFLEEKFSHMYQYETLVSYEEWSLNYET